MHSQQLWTVFKVSHHMLVIGRSIVKRSTSSVTFITVCGMTAKESSARKGPVLKLGRPRIVQFSNFWGSRAMISTRIPTSCYAAWWRFFNFTAFHPCQVSLMWASLTTTCICFSHCLWKGIIVSFVIRKHRGVAQIAFLFGTPTRSSLHS